MSNELTFLIRRAVDTVRAPRDGARWIMQTDMPRVAQWEALLLVVVISVILGQIGNFLAFGPESELLFGPLLANPLTSTIAQTSILVIMVFAIFWIGRAAGGHGGFGHTIMLVAWMQFILVCLQVLQTAAMLVLPPVAGLIGIVGMVLFFWLLTSFVAELHGFSSLGKVFGMILLSMIGFGIGLSIILSVIGISVPGAQ